MTLSYPQNPLLPKKPNISFLSQPNSTIPFNLRFSAFMELDRFIFNRVYKTGFEALDGETGDVVFVRRVVRSILRQEAEEAEEAEEAHLTHAEASRGATVLRTLPEHNNVISLVASGDVGPDFYWVVDFFDVDLCSLIYEPGGHHVNMPRIRFIMRALLLGVDHLHRHGVIHRDLDPMNVFVNRATAQVKIGGFERARRIAVPLAPLPEDGYSLRTSTWYMAPEALMSSTFDGPGMDIWALGCILAEMVLGRAMFMGNSVLHQLYVIYRHLGIPKEEWPALLPDWHPRVPELNLMDLFPPEVLPLLLRMLSINPANRISARECLHDPFFSP